MRIRLSYILAIALAGGISFYMLTGKTVISGQADAHPPVSAMTLSCASVRLRAEGATAWALEWVATSGAVETSAT